MNAREIAKVTMFGGFGKYLSDNATTYKGFVPLEKRKAEFDALVVQINEMAKSLSATNTGYSEEKQKAKRAMSESAATLSGLALVCFSDNGKNLEASQLHIATSDYTNVTDIESAVLADATYDILNKHMNILSPDYIGADELAEFQRLIDTYKATKGGSTVMKQTNPEQTKAFKGALRKADSLIEDIRLLTRKYRSSNALFYDQLIATSTLPPVAVNHTTFSAAIKSKLDQQPVSNASMELSNTKKISSSNTEGFATLEQVRSGQATLTIKAPAYKDLTLQLNLERGKDNFVEIKLDKI